MHFNNWNIEAMTGYHPLTTYYQDFSIAEIDGISGIKETFDKAFEFWKNETKYFTEIIMVLNWKQWEHYQTNKTFAEYYYNLYNQAIDYIDNNWNDEQMSYYFRTTD